MDRIGFDGQGNPLSRKRQRGLSLVELMISITIGMLLIATLTLIFANNSSGINELQKSSQRIDNGRYALEILAGAVQNAGYFAEFDPRQVALPTSIPDPCSVDPLVLGASLGVHVQGYDNVIAGALSCLPDVKPGTDVIVVRRVNGCVSGMPGCSSAPSGGFAFQASQCNASGELGSSLTSNHYVFSNTASAFTKKKKNCTTVADVRAYVMNIYFVAVNDRNGDGIPTLKRVELTGGAWPVATLVQGVEDLQVEYGLDTNKDGSADVSSPAPGKYLDCTSLTVPSCVQHWASVVTARVTLLSRNTESSAGYSDSKIYTLGRLADGVGGASGTGRLVGPVSDAYKRTVFQRLIRFQNASGRNAS